MVPAMAKQKRNEEWLDELCQQEKCFFERPLFSRHYHSCGKILFVYATCTSLYFADDVSKT